MKFNYTAIIILFLIFVNANIANVKMKNCNIGIKFICLGFGIVFIGDNVNLAAHLCDTAYKNNFSEILVNDDVKKNCTKCEVGIENEKFSEW